MLKLRQSIEAKVKRYDEAIRLAHSDKVALTLLREKKRWLCRNDLLYLCCLTGHTKIGEMKDIFQPFCDEVSLMNWKILDVGMFKKGEYQLSVEQVTDTPDKDLFMERLYLCYRGFFKTTIVTKVHVLQLLLNFPNIRIAILHNSQENASDLLTTVKGFFQKTYIGTLFPEYIPEGKEWGNLGGFSVACRQDRTASEDNVEAIGVGTKITGRHWHVAKKDDLVTKESVTTEEQIKKTKDYDDLLNGGHFDSSKLRIQDYSGTRYHFSDLYATKRNDPSIKLIEIKIDDGENFIPTHPTRFSTQNLKLMFDKDGAWHFNCQQRMNPQDPEKMIFRQEMIQYYGQGCKIEGLPRECNFYLLVDPASKRKKRSDYTAMKIVGIDAQKRRFIADMVRDKLNPKQRIDTAIELAKKWSIKESAWEEVGLGDDNFYLEEQRRKEQLFFTVTPVKTATVAKEDRIRNILMPEYAEHKWFWPVKGSMIKYSTFDGKNFDLTEVLEEEFLRFPLGEHDDLLDCETFLSQLSIVVPEENIVSEYKGMTFGEYVKIKEDRLNYQEKRPWTKFRPLSRV